MMHCKKSRYINNGLCLTDMQKCVKERCNQWQPYTNYDRIRNMSVDELAEFIQDISGDIEKYVPFCQNKKICNRNNTMLLLVCL